MSDNLPEWWPVVERYSATAGVDANVLRRIGNVESGFRNVDNQSGPGGRPTSSATGPFQVIRGTWDGVVRSNPQMFADATDRRNPFHQAKVVPFILRSKVEHVRKRIGRDLTPGEQYLAWFAGEEDAARILSSSPDSPITSVVAPGSIQANPSVFRGVQTAGDLIAWADRKMGSQSPRDGSTRRDTTPRYTTGEQVVPAMAAPPTPVTRADERRAARMTEEQAYGHAEGALRAVWEQSGVNWLSKYFGGPSGDPNWSLKQAEVPSWVRTENLDYLSRSVSQRDFETRLARIQSDEEVARRIDAMGFSGAAYRMLGAVLDPVGIAAGVVAAPLAGAVKGGAVARIAAGAAAGAAVSGVAEIPQALENPNWSSEQLYYSVAAGALIGGTVSGIFGRRGPGADPETVQIERSLERIASQARQIDASSSAGAMQRPRSVDPVRADTFDLNTTDVADTFEGAAMSAVRFDATNQLKSSEVPFIRALGHTLAVDGVGRKDASQAAMRAVTVEQSRVFKKADTIFMRDYARLSDDFVARNTQALGGRAQALGAFNETVTRAIRDANPAEKYDPAIMQMKQSHAQLMEMYRRLATGDHRMIDGTMRRAIPGFEDLKENPNYIMRSLNPSRVGAVVRRLGSRGTERLVAEAILSANATMPAKLAFKIARGYVKRMRNVAAGIDDNMNRSIGKGDAQGIREALEEIGISGDELEWALRHFTKNDVGGATTRGMRRQLMDENFEADIRVAPGRAGGVARMERVRVDELFDNDVLRLWRSYNRELSGLVALQRLRIENPRWRPEDGDEIPRYLVDGVTSDGEWEKVVAQVKASIADYNMSRPENQRIAADPIERTLDFLYKSIRGRRLDENVIYDQAGRILRSINFARLMGQVAFAQVQDLTQSIAVTGFRAAFSAMPGLKAFTRRAKDGKLDDADFAFIEDLGIGADWMRGRGPAVDDMGNPATSRESRSVQRFLDRAEEFGHTTGRWTSMLSGMAGVMAFIHRQGAMSIAMSFVREAGGSSGMNAKRLAVLGVDGKMRERILKEIQDGWKRTGGPGSRWQGNVFERLDIEKWNPDVRDAFEYAIFEGARRIAMEGDPGLSRLVLNKTTGKILTQFRTFAINGWTQSTLHNIHMRDAGTFVNILTSSFLAGVTWIGLTHLRSLGMPPEKRQEYLDKNLSWDKVMLAGIGRTAFASLAPTIVDTSLQVLGQEPVFNDFRTTGQSYRLVDLNANPTVDLLNRMARFVGSIADGEISQADFRNATGAVVLNNLLPIVWLKNMVSEGLPTGR